MNDIIKSDLKLLDNDIFVLKDYYRLINSIDYLENIKERLNRLHTNLNKIYYTRKLRYFIFEYVVKLLIEYEEILKEFNKDFNSSYLINLLSYNFEIPNKKISIKENKVIYFDKEYKSTYSELEWKEITDVKEIEKLIKSITDNYEGEIDFSKQEKEHAEYIKEKEKTKNLFKKKYGVSTYIKLDFFEYIDRTICKLLMFEYEILQQIKENEKNRLDIDYKILDKTKLESLYNDFKEYFELNDFVILFTLESHKGIYTDLTRNELIIIFTAFWKNGYINESKLENKNIYYRPIYKTEEYKLFKFNNPSNLFKKLKIDFNNEKEMYLYKILNKHLNMNDFIIEFPILSKILK